MSPNIQRSHSRLLKQPKKNATSAGKPTPRLAVPSWAWRKRWTTSACRLVPASRCPPTWPWMRPLMAAPGSPPARPSPWGRSSALWRPPATAPSRVFPTKGRATCLDTSDEYQCNWMCFVEPAPEASLQNLIAYQLGQDIYFSVQKPIDCGDVLLVGYAPPYGRKMAGPAEEPAPPPPPPVAEQPGGPPVKRKRGRPPRSASAPRNTTVTIIPQANHSDESSAPDTADGTVACYDRQQWTCSQCGRLYRDSVVFARHLQDHYRPVYLRELAGRQRGGGRGARRGRGRPRGQGWSRPFAPPRRSSSPAGAIEEEDEEAVEIGEDTQQVADPDAALERGGEVPAVPAEAPIEESQLGALLEEKEGTRLLIQLEDGTIHEITSYPPNLNLPALGEHDEVHLTGDVSNSTSEPTVTLATLDQLSLQHFHQDTVPQQVVQQMTQQTTQRTAQQTTQQTTQQTMQQTTQQMAHQFRGAKRGRKRKGEVTDREPEVPAARRFKSVERQSAGKYNLRTTRKALVVDEEERYEDGSDYEGEGYSDFEDDYEGGNVAPPGGHDPRPPDPVEQELTEPGGVEVPKNNAFGAIVPKELHVAVEMLTSLPGQTSQVANNAAQREKDHRTGGPLSPSSTRELQNSECVDTPAIQAPEDYEDQNQVVEKFYRSVEQARMDRPKRPGRFRCDLCGKGFNQTLYLFRHIRKHTGEFTCSQCRRVFARKENLQNHACLGMMKSVNYPCTLCGKSFGSDRLLRRHTAKHTGQHMCNDCGKSYTTREILANHSCVRRPPLDRFSCGVCGKAFTRHNYLLKHLPVHTGQHSCPVCGKWLRSLDSLANHVRMCTQVQEISLHGKVNCSHCHQEFTNAAEFRRHQYEHTHVHRCGVCGGRFRNLALLNAHVCQGLPVECDACGQVFDTVSALDEHRPTHGEPQFKCELCGKAFFRGEALSKHPCVHVLDPSAGPDAASRKKAAPSLTPLVCEVCGSRFSSTSSLNVHKNLHGEKRFQCDVCGKRFHRKDLLLEHHAVHGDPTFPCPTCRKLFKTKKSLDVHMMIHSGVKRFKCSVCSKEFFQKGNLQKHEDTHLSERRHRCTVCQKVFTTRESLGRHMLEHTRGRVFTCGICGRAFVKEHQLRNHHRMFHSNQAYTCHYCGLCLKLRHSLKRHLRKKHPEQESQWRNPEVLNNMLVLKGDAGIAATEVADPGLDPGAAVEGLRRASVVGDGNLGSGGLEAVFEGADAIAAAESAREIAESLVANVMTEQGSEVLLAVEGFSSEELREAIATGRAQIKQGPTPDTIEISMPFEVTEGASEQVTYMANLVDAPDHLVADGSTDAAADTVGLQTNGAEVGAEQFVVSGMAEAQAGEEAAAQGQYVTVPMYGMEDRATAGQERPPTESAPATQEAFLASVAEGIPYEEPRFVVARQEVTDGAQVVYETGGLPDQTMSHGAILLDDGTILQQEEQQEGPTDLLFYVLATSASQEDG
ncbi:uncharacterized protein ISCGN_025653 [Ixodes scapularis]